MYHCGAWFCLLVCCSLLSGTRGLKFNDEYRATVVETPHVDYDSRLISDPPTPVTGVVINALCVENDGNPVNDEVVYSIMEGIETLFSIDPVTGEFSVANVPFDYEERPWYLVHILCYLSSDPSRSGTGTVNISIGPLNEFLPIFDESNSLTTIPIPETTPNGAILVATNSSLEPLATYTVSDRDNGPDGVIIYTLHASRDNDDRFFKLDAFTGTLTLNAQLDVDDLPNGFQKLEISITICNMNVSLEICEVDDLIIFVTSANDLTPEFSKPLYTASINESEPNGTVVLRVVCVDDDNGAGGVESIKFSDGSLQSTVDTFELRYVADTMAILSLITELDYEDITEYTFQLVCSDGIHTATTQVRVDVLPVNDNLPQFDKDQYMFSADRSDPSPSDTIIGTVKATDADSGAIVTYSIGNSSYFDIDAGNGEITLKDYLYVSDGVVFDFDVIASDGKHKARTHVQVTAAGLFSVPEIIIFSMSALGLLILVIVVGFIAFCCYFMKKRAHPPIPLKYEKQSEKKQESNTPAPNYEEAGVAGEVKRSHDIQLTSNEAYGPIDKDNIQTSQNTAYGQVQL